MGLGELEDNAQAQNLLSSLRGASVKPMASETACYALVCSAFDASRGLLPPLLGSSTWPFVDHAGRQAKDPNLEPVWCNRMRVWDMAQVKLKLLLKFNEARQGDVAEECSAQECSAPEKKNVAQECLAQESLALRSAERCNGSNVFGSSIFFYGLRPFFLKRNGKAKEFYVKAALKNRENTFRSAQRSVFLTASAKGRYRCFQLAGHRQTLEATIAETVEAAVYQLTR